MPASAFCASMLDMTADAIKELLEAAPFVPFVIHIPERPALRVDHPDFVMLSPTGRTMGVYKSNSDALAVIDIRLITELEKQPRRLTRK